MIQPTVCCICLTADRQALTDRAVKCFLSQTYPNKRLLIWDTGELNRDFDSDGEGSGEVVHIPAQAYRNPPPSIGALRNEANAFWTEYPILIHWDSDDWSAPTRIAEQVDMLIQSEAAAVGYNEMLFWKTAFGPSIDIDTGAMSVDGAFPGEAWRYVNQNPNYCLGTSLCYWRKTWEAKPFADTSAGEDLRFCEGIVTQACSAIRRGGIQPMDITAGIAYPMMIAEVHRGNTHCQIKPQEHERPEVRQWHREPAWDEWLRRTMTL